ncbi:MAG: SoxR reducing system RseC family protein [bacterium]
MMNKPRFGKPSAPSSEVGVVVSAESEIIRVRPQSSIVCEACGSKSLCFPTDGRDTTVEAINRAGAVPGDIVSLSQGEGIRITAALILFGLPVTATIGGTLIGMQNSADPNGGAAVGAIAGLALGLLLVRGLNRLIGALGNTKPIAIEILGHHDKALHT